MNLFSDQVAGGFPNDGCRTVRIPEVENLAWCVTKQAANCPHCLFYEQKQLCCHADCQAIARRAARPTG